MSRNFFAFLVCFWMTVGIGSTAVAAVCSQSLHLTLMMIPIIISMFAGVALAMWSDNPFVSFIGYMMVSIPLGLLLGPVLAHYEQASISKILFVTAGMTFVLGFVGAVLPQSLESWGGWLFGALLLLILGQFAVDIAHLIGIPMHGALTVLDWVGVFIFSAYVMYDMNRAMRVDRTHDNAIDCALALYLDVVNIFLHLINLLGDKNDD